MDRFSDILMQTYNAYLFGTSEKRRAFVQLLLNVK